MNSPPEVYNSAELLSARVSACSLCCTLVLQHWLASMQCAGSCLPSPHTPCQPTEECPITWGWRLVRAVLVGQQADRLGCRGLCTAWGLTGRTAPGLIKAPQPLISCLLLLTASMLALLRELWGLPRPCELIKAPQALVSLVPRLLLLAASGALPLLLGWLGGICLAKAPQGPALGLLLTGLAGCSGPVKPL